MCWEGDDLSRKVYGIGMRLSRGSNWILISLAAQLLLLLIGMMFVSVVEMMMMMIVLFFDQSIAPKNWPDERGPSKKVAITPTVSEIEQALDGMIN